MSSSSQPSTTNSDISNARQIAEARRVLEASIHNAGSRLDTDLQYRAENLHKNSDALSKQEANLATATKALAKETDKLKKVADDAAKKVKELGNVQNWAEVLEREFLVLEETMRLVGNGGHGDSGSEEELEDCYACGQEGREDDILLCDGFLRDGVRCNAPYHRDCVGLKEVPVGDWFCPECKSEMAGKKRTYAGIAPQGHDGTDTVMDDVQDDGQCAMQDVEMHDKNVELPAALDSGSQQASLQHMDGSWS